MFVNSNKTKKNWNSDQFFLQKVVYYSNPGVSLKEESERSYIWVNTVGNSADAKMKNFSRFFCNQGVNVVFCNLGGVCTVDLRLEGEIATWFSKEKFLR